MESRESLRNRIIHYARIAWDETDANNMNPLTGMLIEELCNELYLLDHRLSSVDATMLEHLSRLLSPTQFTYIRPSHAILQIRPGDKHYKLDKHTGFFLKELPEELQDSSISSVVFTPVINLQLHDIAITHQLSGQHLWAVNEQGEKSQVVHSHTPAAYNTVWLRIEANKNINRIKDLCFYIDFPHLDSNHEYYSLMDYLQCTIQGEPVKIKRGIPVSPKETISRSEQDILNYYKDHFYTIDIPGSEVLHSDILPEQLQRILGSEQLSGLSGGCWLSLTFPPHFNASDVSKMRILLNAFLLSTDGMPDTSNLPSAKPACLHSPRKSAKNFYLSKR